MKTSTKIILGFFSLILVVIIGGVIGYISITLNFNTVDLSEWFVGVQIVSFFVGLVAFALSLTTNENYEWLSFIAGCISMIFSISGYVLLPEIADPKPGIFAISCFFTIASIILSIVAMKQME
jgi:hypothetical protein